MKRLAVLLAVVAALIPRTSIALSADSLKEFTGAARVKAVWNRTVYCNEDYTPRANPTTSIMFFDTDVGVVKEISDGKGGVIRISRSGKWVTWNKDSKTYILDLTAENPAARVLLDQATVEYYYGRTWWIDPETKTEYIFCLSNYGPIDGGLTHGDGIYKVAVNADGTAGEATKLTINGNPYVDDFISVSQDGKKLGGAFPWPETKILDIPTGRLDYRHEPGFGCQAALAPDNSYRFTHCEGDHFGVFMFAANMADQHWYVNFSHNLAFFEGKNGMDFGNVHWSNNAQFVCSCPPINDNWEALGPEDYEGKTAAQIKSDLNLYDAKKTVLHKYTADFRDIESSCAIADIRYGEADGDIWLSNGITGDSPTASSSPVTKAKPASPVQISYVNGSIVLSAHSDGLLRVTVTNAQGKLVRRWNARKAASLGVQDLTPGVYYVAVAGDDLRLNRRITIKG